MCMCVLICDVLCLTDVKSESSDEVLKALEVLVNGKRVCVYNVAYLCVSNIK